jgi:diguanylate cyclase (GGDEF)-like protein
MRPPASPPSTTPRLGLPLARLAVVLAAGSVVLAGALGYALGLWIGAAEPWIPALAAGLGMVLTAVPLGVLLVGLARSSESPALIDTVPMPERAAMSRPEFVALAEREWSRARRYGSGAALLLVEIDRFGRHTESLGRQAGEAMLRAMIQDIAPTLRGADALARYDQGQLAVFLAQADAMGALDVAERIRERTEVLEVPFSPQRVRITVSVGVAHLRPAHLHLQALLDDADDALLAARQAGGNCVRAAPVEPSRISPPRRDDQRAPKS